MKSKINPGNQSRMRFNNLLAMLVLVLISSAHADTPPTAIPLSEIGAKATADYHGDALSVAATADGARLRCGFQKLEGHATSQGLWLESTAPGPPAKLRLVASALRRQDNPTANSESSIKLPATGTITIKDKLVRFTRPGVTEEYSVSVDGVRQDFVIAAPPAGVGDLRVELTLSGAQAEGASYGVNLRLEGTGRHLAYSRLHAQDATGRDLKARLEVLSADRLVVTVTDAGAQYPIRIDPTFSDADWVSLNPSLPGVGFPGSVRAIAVDPAGNVYVGGGFGFIGTVPVNSIAKWDGSTWSALGQGVGGDHPNSDFPYVSALLVNGSDLYVGGFFTTAGAVRANNIAKWDGSAWSALGSGMNSNVLALAVSGTNLYAGGYFTTAGGVQAKNIARWDRKAWSVLGNNGIGGIFSSGVLSLAVGGTNLYAGGYVVNNPSGFYESWIARWNGTTWSPVGSGIQGSFVGALMMNGTDLYAGGGFTNAGGLLVSSIAKWDGNVWSALGSGVMLDSSNYGYVRALAVSGTNLYVGGSFRSAGGVPANMFATWNGSTWSALGPGMNDEVYALAVNGTDLYVGGTFTAVGTTTTLCIAKWDGSSWSALGSGGISGYVYALTKSGTNLFIGGAFSMAGGVAANEVAKWDGNNWSALGSGIVPSFAVYVYALAASGTNLYVGGSFTNAGGVLANYIAKWDGSSWSALGSGMNGRVYALATSGTNLYAGGQFTMAGGVGASGVAKWDGNTWSALGSGIQVIPLYYEVDALAVSGTNVYAGGYFTNAGGVTAKCVARWNGSSWSALGSGISLGLGYNKVKALVVNGPYLYAGGIFFDTAGGVVVNNIARWDGNSWSALGSGMGDSFSGFTEVYALAASGTDLYAGGDFVTAGGLKVNCVARWDGNTWSTLGSGMSGYNPEVYALTSDAAGHLFVGGSFYQAGTNVSPYVAQANLSSVPAFVTPLQSQTAETGTDVDFTPDIVGGPIVTCLWFFDDTNLIACSNDCSLAFCNVNFSLSGSYTLIITNICGAVTSPPVMLNVIPSVERRPVPGVKVMGETGSLLNVEYAESLNPPPNWLPLSMVNLTNPPQYWIDLTTPLPTQRFYRAQLLSDPPVLPTLDLHLVPAITLTGNLGDKLRVDCINQIGPTDAWVTLDTVTLTNTSQLYFDTSAVGQPTRLYRIVPVP